MMIFNILSAIVNIFLYTEIEMDTCVCTYVAKGETL
jgi:hypothetical protein